MRVCSKAQKPPPHARNSLEAIEVPLPGSFLVLLRAVEAVTPSSSTSVPSPFVDGAFPTEVDTKLAERRARNRIACRKARLTRKLRRASEVLRVRQREAWQAYLLDLRDELKHTSMGHATAALQRAFLVRSLHMCLVDAEYMASKQSSRGRVPGWPSRKTLAALEQQWKQLTGDLVNLDLSIQEVTESAALGDPSSKVLECAWTLTGVSASGLAERTQMETKLYRGTTTVRFVDGCVKSVETTATEMEAPFNASIGVDAESDDNDNDNDNDN